MGAIEFNKVVTGLGSTIAHLSTLVDTGRSFKLNLLVDYDINACTIMAQCNIEIKSILGIPDDQISITPIPLQNKQDNIPMLELSDCSKFLSPYIQPNTVNVFGKSVPIGRKKKPCIGLCIHRSSIAGYDNLLTDIFPDNRQYPMDVNFEIIKLILKSEYDVITINSHDISLEHKVSMMNELCEAVISYEGGIAHLAHVLQIPTIILPWRLGKHGRPPNRSEKLFTHSVHMDRKTWFLESVDELLNWSPDQLRFKIRELHNNLSNNIYLTHPDPTIVPWPSFCKFERDFFKQYLPHRLSYPKN